MPPKPKKPLPVEAASRLLPRFDLPELSLLDADLTLPARELLASNLRLKLDLPRLPDFDGGADADIDADNVRALTGIYAAAQLEEIKLFAVADIIAEQFQTGVLSLGKETSIDALHHYMRTSSERLTEVERRRLYARCFGPPLGPASEPNSNTAFLGRWHRFLIEAAGFPCDRSGDERQQAARRTFESARSLAINLALHSGQFTSSAAFELQRSIRTILQILSSSEILKAYGVLDSSSLIERVSALYLGATVNTIRGKMLAMSGAAIIDWVADRAASLAPPGRALDLCGNLELLEHVRRWLAGAAIPTEPDLPLSS